MRCGHRSTACSRAARMRSGLHVTGREQHCSRAGACCAPTCTPLPLLRLQYAALATQIGTLQLAEAPRRTIKAVSPAIRKVKRKAALPPEARRQGGGGGGGK